jgi:porphobilinogen deaminase
MILSEDGSQACRDRIDGASSDAMQLGETLADQLLDAAGGRHFLA